MSRRAVSPAQEAKQQAKQRAAVVAEGATWLHTPYHHHGRVKGAGVDCLMLLAEVFERAGVVPHVAPGTYATDWHLHRSEELYAQGLGRYARQVQAIDPRGGEIVLFQFGRTYSHAGLVVRSGGTPATTTVLHAYIGRGVVETTLAEEPLCGRPMQIWSVW